MTHGSDISLEELRNVLKNYNLQVRNGICVNRAGNIFVSENISSNAFLSYLKLSLHIYSVGVIPNSEQFWLIMKSRTWVLPFSDQNFCNARHI